MTRAAFAIPGDLATRSGGYGYDRELIRHLPACGLEVWRLPLPAGFPFAEPSDVEAALALLAEVREAEVLLVDGLAFGALPAPGLAQLPLPLVALVHHPLAFETGLTPQQSHDVRASERAALAVARHVIVTSDATAEILARDYGQSRERITVAVPGVSPALRAAGSGGAAVRLLAVGAVIARKGYDVLVEALAGLSALPWRLTLIGSLDRDLDCCEALRRQVEAAGLAGRMELAGEVSDEALEAAYAGADLFVLPSLFEGYGMVLGEAMARGLPIVATTGGAAADTVPEGAALKAPPGDVAALRQALRSAILDAALRQKLAAASWAAGQALPSWMHCAQQVAGVLKSAAGGS